MPKYNPFNRNIFCLCTVSLLQGLVFYGPIATLYRKSSGLSMEQIALIESCSLLLSLLLEMPWGIAADRIGYKNTMVVCCCLFFLSKVVFWQAHGFPAFLIERLMLSVVLSGLSGVDSALLYLSASPQSRQKVFSLYEALGTAGLLTASLLFSLCFSEDHRRAAFWTMIAYGAAMVLSFFLTEPPHPPRSSEEKGVLGKVILSIVKRPRLLLLLLAFALFQETRQTVTVFLNQLQYQRAGVSEDLWGVILGGMQLLGLLGIFSEELTRFLGERASLLFLTGAGGLSCLMLAQTASPILSVLGVAALTLSGSLLSPLQSVLQNREVLTPYRAAELSVYAMILDSAAVFTNLVFGRAADLSLPLAFRIGGGFCLFACLLLGCCKSKGTPLSR